MDIIKTIKKWTGCKEEEYFDLLEVEKKVNKELEEIIDELEKQLNPPAPKTLGYIDMISTKNILNKYCSESKIFLSDPGYSTTSMEEAAKFTALSKVQKQKYESNKRDCDNFSYSLAGYWSDSLYSFCFGIAWSRTHAFNIMIDDKKQVWICEPQTNSWMKIDDAQKKKMYYDIQLVLI